jgi:hypothetical protein
VVDGDIPRCRRLSQWNTHDSSSNFDLIHCDNYNKNFINVSFYWFLAQGKRMSAQKIPFSTFCA